MTFPIRVFDPPLCCSTGVCGTDVDPELVRFSADLEWLASQGVDVSRVNLAQEPGLFVSDPVVAGELAARGNDCLPLILAAGAVVDRGRYPTREELAKHADLGAQLANATPAALARADTTTDTLVRAEPNGYRETPEVPREKASGCCGGASKAREPDAKGC